MRRSRSRPPERCPGLADELTGKDGPVFYRTYSRSPASLNRSKRVPRLARDVGGALPAISRRARVGPAPPERTSLYNGVRVRQSRSRVEI